MTGSKLLGAAAILSSALAVSAAAQEAVQEPGTSVRPIRLSITSLAATGCMAPRDGNMEVMTATMA